ncbi:MAG: DUF933 domain-containing protein [Actinomycetota bacterium]
MKSIGITGPQGAGKTTFFRALGAGISKADVATVPVPDPRLDVLVELHESRKRVPAQIEAVDVHETARTQAAAIARLRDADAVVVVVANFGGLEAEKTARSFAEELVLADTGPVENRLARARKDASAKNEVPALESALALLEEGRFLSDGQWERPALEVFSPLAPITLKPVIVLWNVDESSMGQSPPEIGLPAFVANASLESEVAGLPNEEALPLLEAYGVTEPVLGQLISTVYRSLDLITFFTAGDTESRAWEVRRGATAPEAAGAIHSDIQRGFIRAEVVSYDVLVECGSWDAAKAAGKLRVEGKDYVFQEGDVTHFRFNV